LFTNGFIGEVIYGVILTSPCEKGYAYSYSEEF